MTRTLFLISLSLGLIFIPSLVFAQVPGVDLRIDNGNGTSAKYVTRTAPASVTLSWTSTNVQTSSCAASGGYGNGWVGAKPASGRETIVDIPVSSTYTPYNFMLECSSNVGIYTYPVGDVVQVDVVDPSAASIASIYPTSVLSAGTTEISVRGSGFKSSMSILLSGYTDGGHSYSTTLNAAYFSPNLVRLTIPPSVEVGNYQISLTEFGKAPSNRASLRVEKAKSSLPSSKTTTALNNRAPIMDPVSFPATFSLGQPLRLSLSASDPDDDNLSWFIDWGDGKFSTSEGFNTSTGLPIACPATKIGTTFDSEHTWYRTGNYTVKITVLDCKGGSDSKTF